MEKKLQNPGVVFALALLCCALWGSAFPCVKIGYEWLAIEGAGSQILFAGYRFFLAGIFTFLIGSFLEKRWLMIRRSSVLPVFGQECCRHLYSTSVFISVLHIQPGQKVR